MEFHPLADIFPLMGTGEFSAFKADVAEHGLIDAITLAEGKIVDGRNRYNACMELGVEPRYEQWDGRGSLLAFIVSKNLQRRHLSESQRAMVAAKMANLPKHLHKIDTSIDVSQEEAAQTLGVGTASVQRAKQVLTSGAPELAQAVEQDKIAVSMAAQMTKFPEREQQRFVELITDGQLRPTEARKTVVAERTAEDSPLPQDKKYRIVYADPPWVYSNTQAEYFPDQGYHYRLMRIDEICAWPVKDMTEDNAVLFLWVTSPILEESFKVVRAWGFQYKASFVWDKVKHVMGHYNSVRHEFLLVCTRGSCQPDIRKLFDSVVTEERRGHSEKPETFRNIIDTLYPNGNRIELFARKRVDGWDCYGNEIPELKE